MSTRSTNDEAGTASSTDARNERAIPQPPTPVRKTPVRKTPEPESAHTEEVPIEGLDTARFECVFPTCGGICCMNGRPPLEKGEDERISKNLEKFLPHLRPEARERIESKGYLTKRMKEGLPSLAVVKDWCIFHNDGCVLHKVGALEGDKWKYKPWRCIAFPLERSPQSQWHVRQWGVNGEAWDLFCLNPNESPKKARDTLREEIAFVRGLEGGKEEWRRLR